MIIGTGPKITENQTMINRAWIIFPDRKIISQDKVHMTRFEKEEWFISEGARELNLFKIGDTLCAVAICYDIEFPRYCEGLSEKGVQILFVPSCTENSHGYWRVRHCSAARAIENQMFVIISSLVGGIPNISDIEEHYGKSVILSPCDLNFPEQGTLAEGEINKEGICTFDCDLEKLTYIRTQGTVLNLKDSNKSISSLKTTLYR